MIVGTDIEDNGKDAVGIDAGTESVESGFRGRDGDTTNALIFTGQL